VVLACGAVFLLLCGACRSSHEVPPNVVLVTVDTLRADRLSPYGYAGISTPSLAKLAREGILFENAFADVTWTVPSMSSVMTGTYPTEHGVRTWNDRLADDWITLAELLAAHGYETAAILGSYALDRRFGLGQGFDTYDDSMNTPLIRNAEPPAGDVDPSVRSRLEPAMWRLVREGSDAYRPDDEVADRAIAWLDAQRASPFFLWVHFFGPHEKGKPPLGTPRERRRAIIAEQIRRYDPDVVFIDQQLGRLLERIDADERAEHTAVVFHSDHGQSLKEHGRFGHGLDIYDTTAHVPLIIRLPSARRAGERVNSLVRNLDIFATILGLAGVEAPAYVASRDLLSRPIEPGGHVYLETYHLLPLSAQEVLIGGRRVRVGSVLKGVRTGEWKLVSQYPELVDPPEDATELPEAFRTSQRIDRLYHLSADAEERNDLARSQPARLEQMRRVLERFSEREPERPRERRELDEAARERLRSLGYLE
jgi:arylsulfatase A-like enzyme